MLLNVLHAFIGWFFSWLNLPTKEQFEILETIKYKRGLLKVARRNNLLDIRTYIYSPYPVYNNFLTVVEEKDLHFYLDLVTLLPSDTARHLKGRANPSCYIRNRFKSKYKTKPKVKPLKKSHKITILKSSRWKDKKGNYITEVIFSKEYDFIGIAKLKNIDHYAIATLDHVVELLNYRDPKDINFEWEIESIQKQLMGTKYLPD